MEFPMLDSIIAWLGMRIKCSVDDSGCLPKKAAILRRESGGWDRRRRILGREARFLTNSVRFLSSS